MENLAPKTVRRRIISSKLCGGLAGNLTVGIDHADLKSGEQVGGVSAHAVEKTASRGLTSSFRSIVKPFEMTLTDSPGSMPLNETSGGLTHTVRGQIISVSALLHLHSEPDCHMETDGRKPIQSTR